MANKQAYVPEEIWRCIFSFCSAFCQIVFNPLGQLGAETEQEVAIVKYETNHKN